MHPSLPQARYRSVFKSVRSAILKLREKMWRRFIRPETGQLNYCKHEMHTCIRKWSMKMKTISYLTRMLRAPMLLVFLFALLIAGCGDDDGPTGGTSDTTPPTVVATNPLNGATGVAVIDVLFDEPMDGSSLTQNSFTVMGPGATAVTGTVSYDANTQRALFMPTNALESATAFTATILTAAKDTAGNALAVNYIWNFSTAAAATSQLPVALLTSDDYAILAGASITNTGITNVTGDLGLSPGTSVTGFPPGVLVGTMDVANPSAAQSQVDLTAAYNSAAGRSVGPISVAGNVGGMTLPPGLYKSSSGLTISSGDLTLDAKGNPNAIWIFQIASTLTTTSGRKVILTGEAKAANVYWQVGTSATLGTSTVFKGTIMADQSISMNTGASLEGRALARVGSVTLNGNTIVKPTP